MKVIRNLSRITYILISILFFNILNFSEGNVHAGSVDMFLAWSSTERDCTTVVAWGDWDNDGDLDLAVGNDYQDPIRVYDNQGGNLKLAWSSSEYGDTYSLAWGDWDGDGDLDLAADRSGIHVYENHLGHLELAWSSPENGWDNSLAWGDWDGDGDLDLAVGMWPGANLIYENQGGNLVIAWTSSETDSTTSVAWGDWDGDGDLDLAVGNHGESNRVYDNQGGNLVVAWSSPELDETTSVAWGDWDGDGDLDLAVGNGYWEGASNRLYENQGSNLILSWSSEEKELTTSMAWGDWDSDGDLDLAVGNGSDPYPTEPVGFNRIYSNLGGNLVLAWSSIETDDTQSVAWGDLDGDGDLDLAVGNHGFEQRDIWEQNRVYENTGEGLVLDWTSSETNWSNSVAWGDWDWDGDLDLAVGTSWVNRVYENQAGNLELAWTSPETDDTTSVAWGDWDGDGDLDLVVGNDGNPNRVYENQGGNLSLVWSSQESDDTSSIAWADWDADGDLDLAVGNSREQANRVYENQGGDLSLAWSSQEMDDTSSVAWGDWDGDGDPDLAVGNRHPANLVYDNQGGQLTLAWTSPETDDTSSLAWGDWDRDGDLDLAAGNYNTSIRLYDNQEGNLALAWSSPEVDDTFTVAWGDWDRDGDLDLADDGGAEYNDWKRQARVYDNHGGYLTLSWTSPEIDGTTSLAWGDYDRDGDQDLALANVGSDRLYLNRSADLPILMDSPSHSKIDHPGGAGAPFFSSGTILEGPTIPINYKLFDMEGDPVRFVKAYYSLDGGSTWQPAVATSGTSTTNLITSPSGVTHTYIWDVYSSGVFGASDNTIFRLDVYQGFESPGPYQYPFRRNETLPFRIRGNQVRVLEFGQPKQGAMVYRLPAGGDGEFIPYLDQSGHPYLTDPEGYLQGYGALGLGDKLVAALPITTTEYYDLFYTSATPTKKGLDAYTVSTLGVQTLSVSAKNPLLLFNLDISLEWDARNNPIYLEQLEADIERTSELVYDWTNGQAALGKIDVFHDKGNWNYSHVRIHATNRLRPNANQGGVITNTITETVVLEESTEITYDPGQVRMGAVWNRFGDPTGTLGEDWPRTLAHELGHYIFFLNDNYLGLDQDGLLIPIDSCPSAMADPYSDNDAIGYDEFHPATGWLPNCERTLSHQETKRSDWETIKTFYPWLNPTGDNPGPPSLQLAVTKVNFIEPAGIPTALEVPIFYLQEVDGSSYLASKHARAFLFQEDWLLDLGSPTQDHVYARGSSPGDSLCVFDIPGDHFGCEVISKTDEHITLHLLPDWEPDIVVTPVTSRTIQIEVTSVASGLQISSRLYPVNDPAQAPLLLNEATPGVYQGTFTDLPEPALDGYVHVYGGGANQQIVADYTMGGSPIHRRSHGIHRRSHGIHRRSHGAPVMSADGHIILFGEGLEFPEGEFYALQTATTLPAPPSWATVVGQAYRLTKSVGAPGFGGTSISLSYLASEVLPGAENWLKVYYYDGGTWQVLDTILDTDFNYATAPTQGEGLYALMSSIEIELHGPGWNLVAYPIQVSQLIPIAFESIEDHYSRVCYYDAPDAAEPWKCHGKGAPSWANDLTELKFGSVYWVYITSPGTIMLRLKPAGQAELMKYVESNASAISPPATYYGLIGYSQEFEPYPGMSVSALISGNQCGQAVAKDINGQVGYVIDVRADNADNCGLPGRVVMIKADSQIMYPNVLWDDAYMRYVNLYDQPPSYLYLPVVNR